MATTYSKIKHDIGILRQDASTIVGMMLAKDKNDVPQYAVFDDEFLAQQYFTGTPGYGNLPPEKELRIIGQDWRSGFGLYTYNSQDPKRYFASYNMDLRFRDMAILGPKATAITLPAVAPPSITNADMELDSDWTNGARSNNQAHGGTYSWECNRVTAYQDPSWSATYQGKIFVFACWVYGDVAGKAKIGIDDGVGITYSKPYSTAAWTTLVVVRKLDSAASRLRLLLYAEDTLGTTPYFDDASFMDLSGEKITNIVDYHGELYFAWGPALVKLNAAGDNFDAIAAFNTDISDLEPFTDNRLYIPLGHSDAYWELLTTTLHNCDAIWNELVDTDVTASLDTTDYKRGTASIKLVVAAACAAGDILATEETASTADLTAAQSVTLFIKSSTSLAHGDLQLLLDDTASCASPVKTLDIPAISADTWTSVVLDIGDTTAAGLNAIISVGIKMVVDKGAFTLRVDNIEALSATKNTLANNSMKFMKTIHAASPTMWGSDGDNTIRSTTNPADGGTAWSAQTTVGSSAHIITELVTEGNSLYIMKEDRPFYLDSSGNVQIRTQRTRPITSKNSGKAAYFWGDALYMNWGDASLLEYDEAGNFAWLDPAQYCTNLSDFDGEIQGIAGDEEYLLIAVDNGAKIEILAGRRESIDGTTSWIWHPISEITLAGCETLYVSNVFQKRVYIASPSSSDSLYYIPLYANYGDVINDANRSFQTDGYFITPWLHADFKGDEKAWIKLTLTMEDTSSTVYFEAHYQKLGDSAWTDIGDFKTSPTTSKFIPVDGSSNNPVSEMFRFKFVGKTGATTSTPKLLNYYCQAVLYPSRREIIACVVRCAEDITLRDAVQVREEKLIRATLDEAQAATWPVTIYPFDYRITDSTKTVKFLPLSGGVPRWRVVKDEKTRKLERQYNLLLQVVPLS